MNLRPYQQQAIDATRTAFRKSRSVLLVSPTGSGKTVMFSYIAQQVRQRGKTVTILVHRAELMDQTSRTMREAGLSHGFIAAGRTPNPLEPVQIASVQTAVNRNLPAPDLLIIDECHHAAAGSWAKLMDKWGGSLCLGVTATPERLDGKPLTMFAEMVKGPSVSWLIEKGFLARPVYYQPPEMADLSNLKKTGRDFNLAQMAAIMDKPKIIGCAVDHYRKICAEKPAVAFCVNLDHAHHMADRFNKAGFRAAVIDGKLAGYERRERVEGLATGHYQILTSCEIVSEGFDLPAIEAAILLRPTASLGLHLQQIGRALRPSPGKARAVILDHVGNCARHGFAETERDWSLEGFAERRQMQADGGDVPIRQCPRCYAVFPPGPKCNACGYKFEAKPRTVDEEMGQLVKFEILKSGESENWRQCEKCGKVHARSVAECPKCGYNRERERARNERREQGRAQSLAELINLGRKRGVKNPAFWARKIMMGRNRKMKGKTT